MMRRENCNCWDAVEDEGGFDVVAAVAGDGVVVVVALGNCLK